MNYDRIDRARFAAELRRRGTLISDEGLVDVCEAFLECFAALEGTVTLELHGEVTRKLIEERDAAQQAGLTLAASLDTASAEVKRLEALRQQGVEMGRAANRRIHALEAELVRLKAEQLAQVIHTGRRD